MKKYEEELINTKTKYKLQFMERITDEYKKRQAIQFFENGFGISIINIKNHDETFLSYTKSEEEYEIVVLEGNKESSRITYDTVITNDVIGYLGIEDVYEIMNKIENLQAVN